MHNPDVEMHARDIIGVLALDHSKLKNLPLVHRCSERGASKRFILHNEEGLELILTEAHFDNLMELVRRDLIPPETVAAIGTMVSLYDEVFTFADATVESQFSELDRPELDLKKLAQNLSP